MSFIYRMITVSVAFHAHALLVETFKNDLLKIPETSKIIVSKSIKEEIKLSRNSLIKIIENTCPQRYGKKP